jgi:hypothetical protein
VLEDIDVWDFFVEHLKGDGWLDSINIFLMDNFILPEIIKG